MITIIFTQATIDLEVTYEAPGGLQVQKKLPSNQPMDFQVRVHVVEARKLFGDGSVNPVVKVACGNEVQHTSTQRGTISPIFDEVSISHSSKVSLIIVYKVSGMTLKLSSISFTELNGGMVLHE